MKIGILYLLGFLYCTTAFSQTKNGVVYICQTCDNQLYSYFCADTMGTDTTCFVTELFIVSRVYKKALIKECEGANQLVLENPSTIVQNLPFSKLKTVKKVKLIGKDMYFDAVKDLPHELFLMDSLKEIELEGMRIPQSKLDSLGRAYPMLSIYGTVKEYDIEFDKSISEERKKQLLKATF